MNKQSLHDEIIRLHEEKGIKLDLLSDENFVDHEQYSYLKDAKKEHYSGWKWRAVVRNVIDKDPETRRIMYQRLLNLLLRYRRTERDYFKMNTEVGNYILPDPLNRLEILYKEYFEIYQKIINQIHFDFPKEEYSGNTIRGVINWSKTLQNSSTDFPLRFFSTIQNKKFETPGNILLVLCARWLNQESSKLLQKEFASPLDSYHRKLLRMIFENTERIIQNFSFPAVMNEAKRYWNLSYRDKKIRLLENNTEKRIRDGIVRNQNYSKLLKWIKKFRDLNITSLQGEKITKHPLESIRNMDTVFEAWIFFEFLDHVNKKGCNPTLHLNIDEDGDTFIDFSINEVNVKFYYERTFSTVGEFTWAVENRPDFTAMINNKIIAIFDAKNYQKTTNTADARRAMLVYLMNLDQDFGALIFANYPKNSHREDLKPNENSKNISDKITLSLLRMHPSNDEKELQFKRETLDAMFNAIANRIPLIAK